MRRLKRGDPSVWRGVSFTLPHPEWDDDDDDDDDADGAGRHVSGLSATEALKVGDPNWVLGSQQLVQCRAQRGTQGLRHACARGELGTPNVAKCDMEALRPGTPGSAFPFGFGGSLGAWCDSMLMLLTNPGAPQDDLLD